MVPPAIPNQIEAALTDDMYPTASIMGTLLGESLVVAPGFGSSVARVPPLLIRRYS